MKDITDSLLKKLAGTAAFNRGQAYYHEGRVETLRQRGTTITALVEGTDTWQVTLRHTATVFEGSCDCPASEGFDFCKHCVAVAMQYSEILEQQNKLHSVSKEDRLGAYFNTWEKQDLVDLLLELLDNDPPQRNTFTIKAETAAGKMDRKAIKKQITAAIPYNRDLFRYPQVRAYFAKVGSVLETLEPLIRSLPPESALELIDYGLERLDRALETIDDSGGFRLHSMEILHSLHFGAIHRGAMSSSELADYLLQLHEEPVSDLYPQIPDDYFDVLGDEGRERFLSSIRAEWEKLPPLPKDDWERQYEYRRLMRPLLADAKYRNDRDTQIALYAKIAIDFHSYLDLSALCLENDQLEEALSWRKKAESCKRSRYQSDAPLQENQIAIWYHTGEYSAILNARWEQFLSSPSLARFLAITKVPGAGDEYVLKGQALAKLQQLQQEDPVRSWDYPPGLTAWAEIHLHYGEEADALKLAEEGELDPELLLEIANRNSDHPERTLPLYFRVAASYVDKSKNRSYKEAIKILKFCHQQLPASSMDRFRSRIGSMYTEYKRKRNFTKWLIEAFPEFM